MACEFYRLIDREAPLPDVSALIAEDFIDNDRSAVAPAELSGKKVSMARFSELRTGLPDLVHRLDILEPIGGDRVLVY